MSTGNKYKTLSKNTFLFIISSFGSKLISFLLVPLYTWVLTTEDYGTVDLYGTTISLLVPVLTLNIQDAVLRFSIEKEYDSKEIISIGIKINMYAFLFLGFVLLFLNITGIWRAEFKYLLYLLLCFNMRALSNCFSMYLKATENVKVMVVSSILCTIVTCFLNLILLLQLDFGVTGYLISIVSGLAVSNIYMIFKGKIYRDCRIKVSQNTAKQMILYSIPLIANSLAWWINDASDRYILTFLCGVAVNGVYAVAYKIPTILSTLQGIFYNAWSISAITEFDKDDTDGFIGNIYCIYSGLSVISCSAIMLLNIPIASVLYSKDFFEAWKYVPFLLLGTVFNGLALFEGCIYTAVKRTKDVSKTTFAGALVNTIFNFILIYFIGPMGAAMSTMLGYLFTWFVRTIGLKKIVKMRVKWNREALSYIILFLQSLIAINKGFEWLQIGCVLALLIIRRNEICLFLKKYIKKIKVS